MKVHQDFHIPANVDSSWRVGIVYSTYYQEPIEALVQGAKKTLSEAGISAEGITEYPVLGSFEVPLIGTALAKKGEIDALIGFGIIVQGETAHADHLARESARAIMDVQTQYQIPFAYEILHVNSLKQAEDRSLGDVNKGKEAAAAVLHSLAQLKRLQS